MTDRDNWQRVNELVSAAMDRPAAERDDWLKAECGEDSDLLNEVLSLLKYDAEETGGVGDAVQALAGKLAGGEPSSSVGKRIGPYRLVDTIGRGGMGQVFLAERDDDEFEQRVAIKMVGWVNTTPALIERFRLERQILATLEHPNIARLLDGGTSDEDVPYLVMEYVDGQTIIEFARDLPIGERLQLFLSICDAVQYAHSQLVVHRDIKPSNVLVATDGTPKLLDFGIAKFLDDEGTEGLTRADARILTPEYASPEQLLGQPVTVATDVYGLGLMLYQLLSGELPFDVSTRTTPEIREIICNTEPAPPSRLARERGHTDIAPQLAGDLDTIVLMALRKEPERRYETVRALADDVRRHLERRPVLARAPSAGYRLGRFVSRHRTGVSATAAALVAAIAMTVVYTTRLQAERDLADTERRTAEAATEFMVDLFDISDPNRGADRDITAREVLDAGAKKLESELADSPRIRARLLHTLGRVYDRLGDYDSAQRLLEEGAALQRSVTHDNDERLAQVLTTLAWVHYRREDWPNADALANEALALQEARVGPNDPSLVNILNLLGTVAYWQDDIDTSLVRYHRSLSILDPDSDDEEIIKDRLVTMNNLAITYDYVDRLEEAQRYYRESLDARIELYGPDHPRVGTAHANLASSYTNDQKWELAREHGLKALAIDRKHLGDEHADVAFDLNILATSERGLENYGKAAEYAKQSAEIWAAKVGRKHSRYANAIDNLATIYRMAGQFEQALPLTDETLAIMLENNGPDHSYTANAHYTRGQTLLGLRRFEEAETHAREASRIREARLGRQHSEYWKAELSISRILLRSGRTDAAAQRLRRLLADMEASGNTTAPEVDIAQSLLAEAESV